MFTSIAKAWYGVNNNAADVKELIPEFFYLPEMFMNINQYNFGSLQNNQSINTVQLPPWANTAEEFIHIHRQALESEYVSANLHHWIDLIFGYKQRGIEAIKALNVYYYLTYEGAIDLDTIQDELIKEAILAQIEHFGQTPSQLLNNKHPKRYTLDELNIIPCSLLNNTNEIQKYTIHKLTNEQDISNTNQSNKINPLIYISKSNNFILTISLNRIYTLNQWQSSTPESLIPFLFISEHVLNKKKKKKKI